MLCVLHYYSVMCSKLQIKSILDEIATSLPEEFQMHEVMNRVPTEERTPYVIVAFQECERMNYLTSEIRRSLKELNLGLKVEINQSLVYLSKSTCVSRSQCYCSLMCMFTARTLVFNVYF